jgi:hypothetical protein
MKVGEKITFAFAGGEKEGMIERLTPKMAFLRVDFPRHKNKLIARKISVLEAGPPSTKDKKKKEKKKKEK